MSTQAVYNFLKQHNRPFSINDIQNSLKDHGKTAVQKALDKLTEEGKAFEKCYGKQKVYCVSQDHDETSTNMEEELKSMDRKINEISINLKEKEEKLDQNLNELKGYDSKMSLAEAKIIVEELKGEIDRLNEKIKEWEGDENKVISEQDQKKITDKYRKCCGEYKKRKRMCLDITDTILDGYPKSKKHLFEETEIEVDEDLGYKFEEIKR